MGMAGRHNNAAPSGWFRDPTRFFDLFWVVKWEGETGIPRPIVGGTLTAAPRRRAGPTTVKAARSRASKTELRGARCQSYRRDAKSFLMSKILVVEDDSLVRALAVDFLSELGLAAEEAGSAAEALVKIDDPDLTGLVIDIGLPDQDGDEIASGFRRTHPHLPIIIASGRGEAELTQKFAGDARIRIVSKPYTLDSLEQALKAVGIPPGR
jgi:CheY-like chemotaxis protein